MGNRRPVSVRQRPRETGRCRRRRLTDPRFAENVEALKSVQPADLAANEIDVRLGASWLPPEDVERFVHDLLNMPSGVEVGHVHALGTWHMNGNWEAKRADREHDGLGH